MAPAQRGYTQRSSKQKLGRRSRQVKEVANAASNDNESMANEEVHTTPSNNHSDILNMIKYNSNNGDEIDYNTRINDTPEAAINGELESTSNEQSKKASVEDEPEPLFSGSQKTAEVKDSSRLENCIAGSCDLFRATATHESELPPSQQGQKNAQPGQTGLRDGGRRYDHLLWGGNNGLEGRIPRTYGGKGSMSGPSGLGYPSSFPQDSPTNQSIVDPVPGSEAFRLDSRFQAEFERECRRASRMHDAKVRELGGPSAGGIYQSGFGRHDSSDSVSEVSSAEMQQAERLALERKSMAAEGSNASVSSIDEDGRDNIRRAQKIKKEQRRVREGERKGGSRYQDTYDYHAYNLDSQTRSFYGTDVPTLQAEIERLRRRAKPEYGAGSRYENEFELRDDDIHDTVSEVSTAELDQAEDEAMPKKIMAEECSCRPMSPFNVWTKDDIRKSQQAKKEERRAREKERRRSHGMPSSVYTRHMSAHQDAFDRIRNGGLGAHSPYNFPVGGHDIDDYDMHHGIGSYPSRMTSASRHFNNDGISSAPPPGMLKSVDYGKDGTTTTTTTTKVTRCAPKSYQTVDLRHIR
ncbi:hypothetical protein LTR56_014874 [Elasticomyces elasticus]|nr:hypothetical protein LTR22_021177 [Elasticomyces elasticus]KAK3635102.1 hypothetical protein LTR56_014874 [Elasticomyces elasticus]KAK4909320.1 hypothetical protein LTR49_021911 [Elasticomyces elasticus]KAK5749887.1 hypothetical protein LTS12_020033 [Elasticomyces elasticus]